MKTKLLKKVRKNYRIIKDGFDNIHLQKNTIFGWDKPVFLSDYFHTNDINFLKETLLKHLKSEYSEYSLKNKIKNNKLKQKTKIWYNKKEV